MERKGLKNWLSFSKKERNALIILIVLVGIFFLVPYLFPSKNKIQISENSSTATSQQLVQTVNTAQLFPFDPNTIDSSGWKKLGLRDKTIRTIVHYREKGGRFRQPEDIRRIYGLHKDEADRLIPYIQIGEQKTFAAKNPHSVISDNAQYAFPIEINKAGVNHWAALPGISAALAQRIVNYRNAMHGFKNIDQVAKTYGLSAATFSNIKSYLRLTKEDAVVEPSNTNNNLTEKQAVAEYTSKNINTVKVNINTASEQDLLSQKHIPKSVAKAIVIYREQHGQYENVADIKKIVFINDEMYTRIAPYLTVE